MAAFIELIAKIKQKNNGTFKLVDAQDVEYEDGKGLDEVLNEKLDKNQGVENANKVLGIGTDGNVTPVEMSDGVKDYNDLENKPSINGVELKGQLTSEDLGIIAKADNILRGEIKKSLNPSIDDSFQRAMWNLKLYGQSTQGADPSPTNKQDITAISQFEGAPTGGNLFDGQLELGGFDENGEPVSSTTKMRSVNYMWVTQNVYYALTYEYSNSIMFDIYFYDENKSFIEKTTWVLNKQIPINCKFIKLATRQIVDDSVKIMFALSKTATTYTPYQSQPFTYTPTQKMYSTQDGSIADYVDVENGKEVYNMSGVVVLDGSHDEAWDVYAFKKGFSLYVPNFKGGNLLKGWCDKFNVKTSLDETTGIGMGLNNNYLYAMYVNDIATTVEEWRAWLSQNPIAVVYPLATPTETPIPQEQLAMLRKLYSYEGVTNFLCNGEVSCNYEISQQINNEKLWQAINVNKLNITTM